MTGGAPNKAEKEVDCIWPEEQYISCYCILAATSSFISAPNITGKTKWSPSSLFRDKYRRRGDGRAGSQCHSRPGPAWQLECWAGWGAGHSATALLAGSCVGRSSSEISTPTSLTMRKTDKERKMRGLWEMEREAEIEAEENFHQGG